MAPAAAAVSRLTIPSRRLVPCRRRSVGLVLLPVRRRFLSTPEMGRGRVDGDPDGRSRLGRSQAQTFLAQRLQEDVRVRAGGNRRAPASGRHLDARLVIPAPRSTSSAANAAAAAAVGQRNPGPCGNTTRLALEVSVPDSNRGVSPPPLNAQISREIER